MFKIYKSVRKLVIAFLIILIKLVTNKNKHASGSRDMNSSEKIGLNKKVKLCVYYSKNQ